MKIEEIFNILENNKNPEYASYMENYMKNNFKFLGINSKKQKELEKEFLKESKKYDINWDFIEKCYNEEYREFQYLAISYLGYNIKKLTSNDLEKIKKLIITKSWWETVDSLDKVVGYLVENDKTLEQTMLSWSKSDNIWLKRVSIDYQQKFKEKTNTKILEQVIINNLDSKEFFINKAIGWSLREYSKTNPSWVKEFINKYHNSLSKLSIKEALKIINK